MDEVTRPGKDNSALKPATTRHGVGVYTSYNSIASSSILAMPGLFFKPGEKRPRDFSVPSLAQRAVTLVLPATNFAWVQVPTECPRVQEPRAIVTQTELCPIRPLIKKFLTIR